MSDNSSVQESLVDNIPKEKAEEKAEKADEMSDNSSVQESLVDNIPKEKADEMSDNSSVQESLVDNIPKEKADEMSDNSSVQESLVDNIPKEKADEMSDNSSVQESLVDNIPKEKADEMSDNSSVQESLVDNIPKEKADEMSDNSSVQESLVDNIPKEKADLLIELKNALQVMEQCGTIYSEAIEDALNQKEDSDLYIHKKVSLNVTLKSYQSKGVTWLYTLYEQGLEGAILADEMGLGKTVQTIAFLAKLVAQPFPNLVVCPLSVLNHWESEIQNFAPGLEVLSYYGRAEARENLNKVLEKLNKNKKGFAYTVLTTPQMILKDFTKLKSIKWNCMIVDEGHSVKNNKSLLFNKLSALKTQFKILLTGTPLQNNIKELWTLIDFVQPNKKFDFKKFEELLDGTLTNLSSTSQAGTSVDSSTSTIVTSLHNILKPMFLRRLKTDVNLDNHLPPKKTQVIDCPMVPEQEEMYKKFLNLSLGNKKDTAQVSSSNIIVPTLSGGRRRSCSQRPRKKMRYSEDWDCDDFGDSMIDELSNSSFASLSTDSNSNADSGYGGDVQYDTDWSTTNITMMLRKILNHTFLVKKPYQIVDGKKELVYNQPNLIPACGKLIVLDQFLRELKSTKHKVLIFSTMVIALNLIEEMCTRQDYKCYRLDGSVNQEQRIAAIDGFNNNPKWSVFLLTTRAGGLGLNLIAADTCIMYDGDWNPQVDLQAEARCHRIGQTKPVCIYRFVTYGTLDEVIYERAQAKLRLGDIVLPEQLFKFKTDQNNIDIQELLQLLAMKCKERVAHPENNYYTEEQIKSFLDRSDMTQACTKCPTRLRCRGHPNLYSSMK